MLTEPTSTSELKQTFSQNVPLPPSHQPPLSVCTLSSLNPVSWIRSFLSTLFQFLKRLLCCGCYPASPKLALGEHKPEIDPRTLSKNDPFRNQVFAFDSNGNFSFRSKESFEKTFELFYIFGTSGYWYWIFRLFSLLTAEQELRKAKPPPLTFLYYIFFNKTLTSYIVHFKEEAIKGRWILKFKTGRDPWEEFLGEQVKHFNLSTNIPEQIPGFCKALGLDEKIVKKFAKEKKWQELIIFVFESRKKHFQL